VPDAQTLQPVGPAGASFGLPANPTFPVRSPSTAFPITMFHTFQKPCRANACPRTPMRTKKTSVSLMALPAGPVFFAVIHGVAILWAETAACAEPADSRPRLRQVVQAGGAGGVVADVQRCGFAHHAGNQQCNDHCRDGGCPAHCPVRPQTFGFYGTQWRPWPTQQAEETRDVRAATPVPPRKSAVPGIDEESLKSAEEGVPATEPPVPDFFSAPAPEARPNAARADGGREAESDVPGELPPLEPTPSGRSEGATAEAVPEQPTPAPPTEDRTKSDEKTDAQPDEKTDAQPDEKPDENIFDEAGRSRRRNELFAVLQHRAVRESAARVDASESTIELTSHPQTVGAGSSGGRLSPALGTAPLQRTPEQGGDDVRPLHRGLRGVVPAGAAGNPLRGNRSLEPQR
jgi:hypothetical protein